MLYKTPPEELSRERPRPKPPAHSVIPVLIAILFLGALALGGAWLMIRLIKDDQMFYCIASGRHNCAVIPDEPQQ
jgi:hypothetical protein